MRTAVLVDALIVRGAAVDWVLVGERPLPLERDAPPLLNLGAARAPQPAAAREDVAVEAGELDRPGPSRSPANNRLRRLRRG